MADHARAGRMAKRIQAIVANALEHNIKDRRVELVTVTDTRVTGDLHDATVYYTVRGRDIDDEPDFDAAAEALHRARGQLRKLVGDQLGVRFTPTLSFEVDTVPESSAHMEQLLEKARARDAELAKLKENAQPAGEANPYKEKESE
ncbi:30S ribosome-binding factor RbfA [Corynebacterium sp. 32222D000AT]|uniref:30S ribosome-binding factor RbfA n=1 Tax=Corynebacterium TaxID=1716 RepID=UPI0008A4EB6B|nr:MULTISPECIES: 30S ribosome-binding factor RbfA [Corynebacterium]MDD7582273.1 30S ribosome-binding factor RbfA [Mycobacteriaceae bacterium]MDY5828526.1 30S ribosome-binding factor RbfA [Corynebacterium sp.]OFS22276.1 ribosome-binding factor A [Corynebacterium sp. HMSC04H06]WJY89961.1 Ribosome-binding factor A [Corynebacterium confusum]